MKPTFTFILAFCFTLSLQSQIAKTVDLAIPGSLNTILSDKELAEITDLTLTGHINELDFLTMRDSMPALINLDFSGVTIHSWSGIAGTFHASSCPCYYSESKIPDRAFKLKKLKSVAIPLAVTSIGEEAFSWCSSLTEFTLPPLVTSIGQFAFNGCTQLKSFYVNTYTPVDLSFPESYQPPLPPVFSKIIESSCTLYVPYGTKALYAAAYRWKDFKRIEEASSGFTLGETIINFDAKDSSTTVELTGNVPFTVTSDQSWLSVTPDTGTSNQTLTLTVAANSTVTQRRAMVTVTADGVPPGLMIVTQEGAPKSVTITAGNLHDALTAEELKGITHLNLKGSMDARDFMVLRDSMPLLSVLDIEDVTVEACTIQTEIYGEIYTSTYKANEIPPYAFSRNYGAAAHRLTSIIFPSTITSIGTRAFESCTRLSSMTLPSSLISFEPIPFLFCHQLTSVYVKSTRPVRITEREFPVFPYDKKNCTLYVPYGTAPLYAQAYEWKDFAQIVEAKHGFLAEEPIMILAGEEGTTATVNIKSNIDWNVRSDQEWLTVSPVSGSGNGMLTVVANANPFNTYRKAKIIVSAAGAESQTIEVLQTVISTRADVTVEGVLSAVNDRQLAGIKRFAPNGTMDARDFKIMRDKMPSLEELDLSGVKIAAYSGPDGTHYRDTIYHENVIPVAALRYAYSGNPTLLKTVILPSSATAIDELAFANCSKLLSLSIPSTIRRIDDYAIAGCTNLVSITIPSSITSLGKGVFAACKSLTSVSYPPSLTSIKEATFFECSSLTSFTIPLTVDSIGVSAFSYCLSLDSITIPPSVTYLGSSAFSFCNNLKIINLPSSVTYLGAEVFLLCTSLKTITIPSSITSINIKTFYKCTSLTDVILSASVTEILKYAFESCSLLDSITIPSSVIKIEDRAFDGCGAVNVDKGNLNYCSIDGVLFNKDQTKLLHVPVKKEGSYTVPPSVITIATALANCSNITSVNIPSSVTEIPDGAFFNCSNMTSVNIPSSVKRIGDFVFNNCSRLISIEIYHLSPEKISFPTYNYSFEGVNTNNCVLVVPYGTKSKYMSNYTWNRFKNIIERSGFLVPAKLYIGYRKGSTVSTPITGNLSWTAQSQDSWLTVNTLSGEANQELTLTAEANPTYTVRVGRITVSGQGVDSQTIVVRQYGIGTATDELDDNKASLNCYPNPFAQQMTIEIANPSPSEVTVEIYSISGQKIRTLARALKGQNITLTWDGEDEQGRKAAPGVYLLKMNEEVRKVVKR